MVVQVEGTNCDFPVFARPNGSESNLTFPRFNAHFTPFTFNVNKLIMSVNFLTCFYTPV